MKHAVLAIAMIFSAFQINAQTDEGKSSDSKMIEVSRGIYMYQNKGGNIGFSIGADGVFMIDDQFADLSADILKDLKRLTKETPKFVVNTHHHGDHTGGNANMAKEGAIVVAHENVRNRLIGIRSDESQPRVDRNSLPKLTFKENMTFHFNGEEIFVFHIHNAHTDGDAIVHFTKSNVLHTGDALVEGRYPYIDSKNGGSVQGYIEGLEAVLMLADNNTKIIPGHGNVTDKKAARDLINLLNSALKRVTYMHLTGKTEAQILAMTDITKTYDEQGYGDGFVTRQKFLKSIYDDVAKQYDKNDMEERKKRYDDIKAKSEAADKKRQLEVVIPVK